MIYERRTKVIDNIYRIEPVSAELVADMRFRKKIDKMAADATKEINGMVTEAKVRLKLHRGPILEGTVPNDVFARLDSHLFNQYAQRQQQMAMNSLQQLGGLGLGGYGQAQRPSTWNPFAGIFGY